MLSDPDGPAGAGASLRPTGALRRYAAIRTSLACYGSMESMLIVIGGLPGTGKTTLARLLAARVGAVHLRIDTIEQAIVRSGLAEHPLGPVGYTVGYALSKEHLQQGLTVIAESVNPLSVTRDAWRDAGADAGVTVIEIEVICSDPAEHQQRVISRSVDIPDLELPNWQQVLDHDYEPWGREHVIVDTAGQDPQVSLASLVSHLDRLAAGRDILT